MLGACPRGEQACQGPLRIVCACPYSYRGTLFLLGHPFLTKAPATALACAHPDGTPGPSKRAPPPEGRRQARQCARFRMQLRPVGAGRAAAQAVGHAVPSHACMHAHTPLQSLWAARPP